LSQIRLTKTSESVETRIEAADTLTFLIETSSELQVKCLCILDKSNFFVCENLQHELRENTMNKTSEKLSVGHRRHIQPPDPEHDVFLELDRGLSGPQRQLPRRAEVAASTATTPPGSPIGAAATQQSAAV
jgi:hypothetical protein